MNEKFTPERREIKHVCCDCGAAFAPTCKMQKYCPDCAAARKRNTVIRQRTCRECGAQFDGGPRAWYCPSCRADRKRAQSKARNRGAPQRKLGSTDQCARCGKDYVVTASLQRYCKECAPAHLREVVLPKKRSYAAQRSALRDRKTISACVICGKAFDTSIHQYTTCSPECAEKLRKESVRRGDLARRQRERMKKNDP